MDKTLAGELDELKERMIGMQLFGRDPSYDTGEDAIVRVTATDVRRRLKRFYDGVETGIRLELQPGSYIIELIEQAAESRAPEVIDPPSPSQPAEALSQPAPKRSVWRRFLLIAAALTVLGLLPVVYHYRMQSAKTDRLPWSVMLPRRGELKIVLSDPDIVALEGVVGNEISLSDYAGHHYVPEQQLLDHPSRVIERLFKGNNVPVIDARFALGVRGLLPSSPIEMYRARVLQSQDFKTEDNFILLGSPLSNPWVSLFQDQLDFYFQYDPARHGEIIYNRHAEHGEAPVYVPTTPGWGTGEAFAIIALLANENQTGHILILAGSNSVATEAAYRLATDVDSIVQVLHEHGLNVYDRNAQFEILLRVNTMASSLNTFDVVACHRLSRVAL
ncbi:hypothetical protein [Paracidobacterium acidisoli]|uniref:hypothetical protein n=1 Tax=Paracidobacterium acidisoli TaxID=2303751 RepID=UPI0011C110F3|nr:hypothetical protein [Paracidobacterium acidisoli]MBT9331536.1 hypothetical protein [Paracidobacterium acidisoli]